MPDTQQEPEREPTDDELMTVIDKHCIMLMEHFDCVRIFVVKHNNQTDVSSASSRGRGNYFAQRCAVEDWLIGQRAQTRRDATAGE